MKRKIHAKKLKITDHYCILCIIIAVTPLYFIMKREINQYLKEWKSRKDRNPLIVRGARQVGKTYVIEEFAKRNFKNCRNLMEFIVSAAVYGV